MISKGGPDCTTTKGLNRTFHFVLIEPVAVNRCRTSVAAGPYSPLKSFGFVWGRLKTGTPAVYVNESGLHAGVLVLSALSLDDRTTDTLIERLRQALTN